jgi:8-oxo-dGTP diphosphatase
VSEVSAQAPDKSRYKFIPRVLVFLTRGNEVLLIKRGADRAVFPNQYNGLGGHVEKGESVLEAARREVEEESGLTPGDLWLCAVVAIDTGDSDTGIVMWVFRGEADGEPRPSTEGEIAWMPVSRIGELDMVEDIPALLPKVLAMKRDDAPLWGKYTYDEAGKLKMHFD